MGHRRSLGGGASSSADFVGNIDEDEPDGNTSLSWNCWVNWADVSAFFSLFSISNWLETRYNVVGCFPIGYTYAICRGTTEAPLGSLKAPWICLGIWIRLARGIPVGFFGTNSCRTRPAPRWCKRFPWWYVVDFVWSNLPSVVPWVFGLVDDDCWR